LSVNIRTAKETGFCGHVVKLGGNFPSENGIGNCTQTAAQSVDCKFSFFSTCLAILFSYGFMWVGNCFHIYGVRKQ